MILLFLWITRYRAKLKQTHGDGLLTSHRQALQAMARCRQQGSDLMVLACQSCQQTNQVPHSCRHRSCPHCQHFESQQWIERQTAELLPVRYFLLALTMPFELKAWFRPLQHIAYDLLLRTASLTVQAFGRRDPKLNRPMGARAVLQTHIRRLEYHHHLHLLVAAGAGNKRPEQWRCKNGESLSPVANLTQAYRSKSPEGCRLLGGNIRATLPSEWLVHCKAVGRGEKALAYLGRDLHRGVPPEKAIPKDQDGSRVFATVEKKGTEMIQALAGAEARWLHLLPVNPKRIPRVKDIGWLPGPARALIL